MKRADYSGVILDENAFLAFYAVFFDSIKLDSEFEKELARNYDRKLSIRDKFSPYFINKGVLVRQVFDGHENVEINARDLKTTEELITFYENFFKLVDNVYENTYKSLKDNCQNSDSKYFNKLSCFLAGGYDSFERIYNNHNSGQTDSLSFIFKKDFKRILLVK